jgi:hypothetical protein
MSATKNVENDLKMEAEGTRDGKWTAIVTRAVVLHGLKHNAGFCAHSRSVLAVRDNLREKRSLQCRRADVSIRSEINAAHLDEINVQCIRISNGFDWWEDEFLASWHFN